MRRPASILLMAMAVLVGGCRSIVPPASPPEFAVSCDLATVTLAEGLLNAYEDTHPGARLSLRPASRTAVLSSVASGDTAAALLLFPPDEPVFHTPVAREGIVFVAAPGVPVDNLSQRDARALLAGRIAAWPTSPGDSPLAVTVISDEADGSSRLAVETLLMREQAIAPAARLMPDTGQLLNLVAETPGAVSYVPYNALTVGSVVRLSFDGVPPTPENIQSNRYGLITTVEFVSASEPTGSVRGFLEWILSPEGQRVVRRYAFSLND